MIASSQRSAWRIPDSSRYSDELKQARKQTGPGLSAAPPAHGKKNNASPHSTARRGRREKSPHTWGKQRQSRLSLVLLPSFSFGEQLQWGFFPPFSPILWDVMKGERYKKAQPGRARYALVFTDGRTARLIIEKEVWDCAPLNTGRLFLCFPV